MTPLRPRSRPRDIEAFLLTWCLLIRHYSLIPRSYKYHKVDFAQAHTFTRNPAFSSRLVLDPVLINETIGSRMKFLEISELDMLSRALDLSTPTLKVSTRVEAYSCKPVARERKLFKTLESELIQDLSHSTSVSPPEQHPGLLDSAFGPLDKRESRKTLWLLIGLLNVAFPDHDFSKVRPEEFRREEGPRAVLASLSSALDHLRSPTGQRSFSSYPPASSFAIPSSPFSDPMALPTSTTPTLEGDAIPTNPFLRRVLDPIIDLSECEVYSYTPDIDSDPHAYESDDESDDDGEDPDAFERDSDGGMTWEMDGIDASSHHHHHHHSASNAGVGASSTSHAGHPSSRGGHATLLSRASANTSSDWYSRPSTPMKSISSVFRTEATTPATPASLADTDDYFGESSTGGLLWSTFSFLYNRKAKRVVFISAWARTPRSSDSTRARRVLSKRYRSRSNGRSNAAHRTLQVDAEDEEEEDTGNSSSSPPSKLSSSLKRSASQTSELAISAASGQSIPPRKKKSRANLKSRA